jgi:hypothetical protein
MSIPLKIKIEKALTEYLAEIFDGDEDLNVYEGHSKNPDKQDFPWLIVYAEDSGPVDDMPTQTGIRNVRVRLSFQVDSEVDPEREGIDSWREIAERAMDDVPGLAAFINPPDEGEDDRVIKDLYFYDCLPTSEQDEMENTDWVEQMSYDIICQSADPRTGQEEEE